MMRDVERGLKATPSTIRGWCGRLRAFSESERGNVALLTAILMVPMVFALGLGIDFTLSRLRQDQINGIADAAALAAVAPNVITQTDPAVPIAAAQNVFYSQIAQVPDVNYSQNNLSVTISNSPANSVVQSRTVTVSYTATSNNVFGGVLGANTLPIQGSSTATSTASPSINFYMLLDDSPSMALPTTTAGILQFEAATPNQEPDGSGCAFACHQSNPAGLGNPGGIDNYALAKKLGIPLRIDNVNTATQTLLGASAPQTAANNNTTYQAAIFTMDTSIHQLTGTSGAPSTAVVSLSSALAAAGNILPQVVCTNNYWICNQKNSDENSYLDNSLATLNIDMPNPGNGTANPTDTPQEILFIVSDNLNDDGTVANRTYGPLNTTTCATIKNRGIRIAFLYLTYFPPTNDNWYNTSSIPAILPTLAPSAQACASPGLFFQVSTDGDINAAMQTLFQKAVATARLSQ